MGVAVTAATLNGSAADQCLVASAKALPSPSATDPVTDSPDPIAHDLTVGHLNHSIGVRYQVAGSAPVDCRHDRGTR